MSDYEIGYRKPPLQSRFKPGVSGNPKGRPKRQSLSLAQIIDSVLGMKVTFREKGRAKTATRDELCLKRIIESAVQGDVTAAGLILKIHAHARRFGSAAVDKIEIHNWLPDDLGGNVDQNQHSLAEQDIGSDTVEWWHDSTVTKIPAERSNKS